MTVEHDDNINLPTAEELKLSDIPNISVSEKSCHPHASVLTGPDFMALCTKSPHEVLITLIIDLLKVCL